MSMFKISACTLYISSFQEVTTSTHFEEISLVHTGGGLSLVPLFKTTAISAGVLAFSGVSTYDEASSLSGHNLRWAEFHHLWSLKMNMLGPDCCCNDKGLRTCT